MAHRHGSPQRPAPRAAQARAGAGELGVIARVTVIETWEYGDYDTNPAQRRSFVRVFISYDE